MQEVVVSSHTGHLTRLADILVVVMMINFLVILAAVVDVDVVLMKQLNFTTGQFISKVGVKFYVMNSTSMSCQN